MAVKLRLRREGTKKRPHFRVVAADSRSPRNGRFIEILGEYHPMEEPSKIEINGERALHWLQVGAKPTEQVEKLLRISGVWEQFKPDDAPARDRSAETSKPKLSKKAKARLEEEREAAADAAAEAKAAAEAPAADAGGEDAEAGDA